MSRFNLDKPKAKRNKKNGGNLPKEKTAFYLSQLD